ncbi:MAG: NAD-dependent epimerase/dehydratase family protein [Pseudomonadota bacterium]
MTRKTLVTGGCGFVGRHLVAQLVERGKEVVVLDPGAADPAWEGFADKVTHLRASITDRQAVQAAVAECDPVFHLAAIAHLWASDPAQFHRVNMEGTRILLDVVRAEDDTPKLIATSTEVILRGFNMSTDKPLTESEPPPSIDDLAGPYSRSKFEADRLVRDYAADGGDVVSLYPTVPIGPGDVNMTAPTAMLEMFLKKPPPAYLPVTLDLVPVGAVARAHILAAEKARAGARYLISGSPYRFEDLMAAATKKTGLKMPNAKVPYRIALMSGYLGEALAKITGKAPAATREGVRLAKYSWRMEASHARDDLGWEVTRSDCDQALEEAFGWLLERGKQMGAGK